jgi:cytidylate kinase
LPAAFTNQHLVRNIIIAIDGYSSCGKSTLARDLASALRFGYVDSGAMYRAVTLYFIELGIDFNNHESVAAALNEIHIEFKNVNQQNRTFLNGRDVEDAIRDMRVSAAVSPVAAIPAVRRALVQQQKVLGEAGGIVMDGRDIGTVVFPHAELKIFLTADPEERVQRRKAELNAKGLELTEEVVRENLMERDRIDSTRADSPLRQADDAIVIDNTLLNRQEQLELALQLAREIMKQTA